MVDGMQSIPLKRLRMRFFFKAEGGIRDVAVTGVQTCALPILEAQIQDAGQVIVDIYSRFLFEKEVLERREQSELSVEELNDMMEHAQKATFGDGLDERHLQKFMWTWKPHYYDPNAPFYNFPYAFGLLFATGLYAIYQQQSAGFIPHYMNLLASTSEDTAAK